MLYFIKRSLSCPVSKLPLKGRMMKFLERWKIMSEAMHCTINEGMNGKKENEKQWIYLDNAATTKTSPEVVKAMLPFFSEYYGNPSSVYEFSNASKQAVAQARQVIADSLGAKAQEIYFTAGGSEADNWALKATAEAYAQKGRHIITSKIEHHAILHTCPVLPRPLSVPPVLLAWAVLSRSGACGAEG